MKKEYLFIFAVILGGILFLADFYINGVWKYREVIVAPGYATTRSALVLDMNGNDVEILKLGFEARDSHVYFDIDNDNFSQNTAWPKETDAFLVYDQNDNGIIENQRELIGNTELYRDGFAHLKFFDSNNDNKITPEDKLWNKLQIWEDRYKYGITEKQELKGLSEYNISEIDLLATRTHDLLRNENMVSYASKFIMGGKAHSIEDIWFQADTYDTGFVKEDDVLDGGKVYGLPNIKGYGKLPSLHVEMSEDDELLHLVKSFKTQWDFEAFKDTEKLNKEVDEILFRWAHVDNISPKSTKSHANAQYFYFMQLFTGNSSIDFDNVNFLWAKQLDKNYLDIRDTLKAHLIAQVGGEKLFDAPVTYIDIDGSVYTQGIISSTTLNDLSGLAGKYDEKSRAEFWKNIVMFIVDAKFLDDLTFSEIRLLNKVISESGPGNNFDAIIRDVAKLENNTPFEGTDNPDQYVGNFNNNILNGNDGDDRLYGRYGDDTINGGAGSDVIFANVGNDRLNGGTGDDFLHGSTGGDTYYYNAGDGFDIINDTYADDIIELGEGFSPKNLRVEREGKDISLLFQDQKIMTFRQYLESETNSLTLKFYDGALYPLSELPKN